MTSDDRCTLDRVTQAVCLHDASGAVGGVWGVGVHGTAPASITAVYCAAAIQYSLSLKRRKYQTAHK